jgi:hypothetical protein
VHFDEAALRSPVPDCGLGEAEVGGLEVRDHSMLARSQRIHALVGHVRTLRTGWDSHDRLVSVMSRVALATAGRTETSCYLVQVRKKDMRAGVTTVSPARPTASLTC